MCLIRGLFVVPSPQAPDRLNQHPPDDQLSDPRLLTDDGICKSVPSPGVPVSPHRPCWVPPTSLLADRGQEHGRTIPLADLEGRQRRLSVGSSRRFELPESCLSSD